MMASKTNCAGVPTGLGGAGGGSDGEDGEMAELEREYEAMRVAEVEAAAGLQERAARERQKALAVRAQQQLWQRGLEARILLQRALQGANRLPQVGGWLLAAAVASLRSLLALVCMSMCAWGLGRLLVAGWAVEGGLRLGLGAGWGLVGPNLVLRIRVWCSRELTASTAPLAFCSAQILLPEALLRWAGSFFLQAISSSSGCLFVLRLPQRCRPRTERSTRMAGCQERSTGA
jgi:hypothetical protein